MLDRRAQVSDKPSAVVPPSRTLTLRWRDPVRKALVSLVQTPMNSSPARMTVLDCALMALLCAAAAVVLGKDITSGGLADADSAAHVMDGVLIHDWVMAGPSAWQAPMEFARQQYGHYPTLGIGRHYPPGFAIVEAAFFAAFGISAVSARLCVLLFGLIAITGTFVFARGLAGRSAGVLAAMTLLAMPATTLWGRQTMLEVPTVAVLTWGAVAFSWYLRNPTVRRLALLLAVVLSAIAFKQSAVFLVCATGMTLIACAFAGVVPIRHGIAATVTAGATLLLVILSFDRACLKTLSGYNTYSDPWSFGSLSFYLRTLPYSTGLVLLTLAALGAAASRRTLGAHWLLLASWTVVAYVMVTAASLKVPRFFYVGLFPLAVWAALGMRRVLTLFPKHVPRGVLTAGVAVCLLGSAFARPVRQCPDYGPVVAAHRDSLDRRVVLFSGLRDGDFIFAVREQLPWQSCVVVRGSKLLYTCTAGPQLDLVSYVNSAEQLTELMRRFAFDYVFIERENKVGTREDDFLRRYLSESGDYRLDSEHQIGIPVDSCRFAKTVDVYKLTKPIVREVKHFDIPMPRTGKPIRIALTTSLPRGEGP